MNAQEVDFDRLGENDYAACHFVTMCCVARALASSLRDLVNATEHRYSWRGVVNTLNKKLVDELPEVGQEPVPKHYIDWARSSLRNLARTHKAKKPALAAVLNKVARRVVPFKLGELRCYFESLGQSGWARARQCLEQWGGPRARAAASRLKAAVPLRFVAYSGHRALDLYFDRDDKTIVVPVGMNTGMLRSCLNLEFYFLHEYVSHVFSSYQDVAGIFAECYLMAVEKAFFASQAETYVQVTLSKDDFDAHQRRIDSSTANPLYFEILEFAAWLIDRCDEKKRIAGILLDLAATPVGNDVHELLLARLEGASPADLRQIICLTQDGIELVLQNLPSKLPISNNL